MGTLKDRKGFVKLALRHGADLVPVLCYGENEIFDQADNPKGSLLRLIQDFTRKYFTFSVPLVHGRGVFNYDFGLMPHRRAVTAVVGSAIKLPGQAHEPSEEEINKYHKLYIA